MTSTGGRDLAVSWAVQGIGWFATLETAARVALEGGFCLLLAIGGLPLLLLPIAWISFHTLAWLWIYGGWSKLWTVLGTRTDPARLRAYLESVTAKFSNNPSFEAVFLRGSASRGLITETSDIDVIVVPARPYARSVLALWALRFASALRRIPLEAVSMDAVGEIPFRMGGTTPTVVKGRPAVRSWSQNLADGGILVTFSGIDGSGKTTVAKDLVADLRRRGFDAVYFYAHRQTYHEEAVRPTLTIAFRSLWIRTGHVVEELRDHPRAKFLLDALTVLDYLAVRLRLLETLRAGRIVIADRYVPDVIAYLRSLGPVHRSIEGLLVGIAPPPDLSLLFEIAPERAFARKPERPMAELERFARDYQDLRRLIPLTSVDASLSAERVAAQVTDALAGGLGMPAQWSPETPPRASVRQVAEHV